LSAKFRGLAAPVVGEEGADRLRQAVAEAARARTLGKLARP
jgi:hypothetical protein